MPRRDLQEIGERKVTAGTFSEATRAASFQDKRYPLLKMVFFETGSEISDAKTRPKTREAKFFPSLSKSFLWTSKPASSLQSGSLTMTSCTTSTNLRVRYPAAAVLSAVSAVPFLEACVEIKYSKTARPSLKLESMGSSIVRPEGFTTSPFMEASWLICAQLPLAPEETM